MCDSFHVGQRWTVHVFLCGASSSQHLPGMTVNCARREKGWRGLGKQRQEEIG